jgi:S-methylmethionine-dependent homocysteine/selenocysteine methylase
MFARAPASSQMFIATLLSAVAFGCFAFAAGLAGRPRFATEFAAHTLLPAPAGRAALTQYFEAFLRLATEMDTGFILDTVTWKAHAH